MSLIPVHAPTADKRPSHRLTRCVGVLVAMAMPFAALLAQSAYAAPSASTTAASAQPESARSSGASAADQAPTAPANISTRINAAAVGAYSQIENLAYRNQCIDAPGGALNVRLRLAQCNSGSATQKWTSVRTSPTSVTYYLVNQRSGYCAEVNNGTNVPGEAVDQWGCNGSPAEQWIRSTRYVDNKPYTQYTHAGTNQCLDTVGGPGSQLMQWFCGAENDAQTWLVR